MGTPEEILSQHTRRVFLERSTLGLGAMAATSLLDADETASRALSGPPHLTEQPNLRGFFCGYVLRALITG